MHNFICKQHYSFVKVSRECFVYVCDPYSYSYVAIDIRCQYAIPAFVKVCGLNLESCAYKKFFS